MTYNLKPGILLMPFIAPVLLTACVSQGKYDDLQAQNQQLHRQNATLSQQVSRLQGAIKYTVNSDLLFPPGGWQMSSEGKQIIGKMASTLASAQQSKLFVNGYTDNAPVGPGLQREGISSNQILSQKRAENVMEYLISQGVKPDMVAAQGYGDTSPAAPNNTAQGRAQNRRVELTLAKPSA